MNLNGKTIIITGAARAGQAVAHQLLIKASKTCTTYLHSVDELGTLPHELERLQPFL